jgi:hypothetical protein
MQLAICANGWTLTTRMQLATKVKLTLHSHWWSEQTIPQMHLRTWNLPWIKMNFMDKSQNVSMKLKNGWWNV